MGKIFGIRRGVVRASEAGFTIVELTVVFVLIAIIGGIIITPTFLTARLRGSDTVKKKELEQLAGALEQYVNDHGTYPQSSASGQVMACGATFDQACTWGVSEFRDVNGTLYMARFPADRDGTFRYYYQADPVGLSWQLFARLKNDQDDILDLDGDGDYDTDDENLLPAYAVCTTGSDSCNYGISSTNVTKFQSI